MTVREACDTYVRELDGGLSPLRSDHGLDVRVENRR